MNLQQLDTFSAKIIGQNYNIRNAKLFKSRDFYQEIKQLKFSTIILTGMVNLNFRNSDARKPWSQFFNNFHESCSLNFCNSDYRKPYS
jgi:hypothetical protein